MNQDLLLGVVIGVACGLVLALLVGFVLRRRRAKRHRSELAANNAAVRELRQEMAEDRQTNRRLRHELAVQTPKHLIEAAEAQGYPEHNLQRYRFRLAAYRLDFDAVCAAYERLQALGHSAKPHRQRGPAHFPSDDQTRQNGAPDNQAGDQKDYDNFGHVIPPLILLSA